MVDSSPRPSYTIDQYLRNATHSLLPLRLYLLITQISLLRTQHELRSHHEFQQRNRGNILEVDGVGPSYPRHRFNICPGGIEKVSIASFLDKDQGIFGMYISPPNERHLLELTWKPLFQRSKSMLLKNLQLHIDA